MQLAIILRTTGLAAARYSLVCLEILIDVLYVRLLSLSRRTRSSRGSDSRYLLPRTRQANPSGAQRNIDMRR
jgi:hypothetical protein